MAVFVQIKISESIFIKDPLQSDLGKKIIDQGIRLVDQLGFEEFTFKKLAAAINSTEASVYRYFENKHKFLIYIISWYWAWLEFLVDYKTNSVLDPKLKIKAIIKIIAESGKDDPLSSIDESILHRIVVAESSKAYLTKNVDFENQEGFFSNYKSLCKKISDIIQEASPNFPYPRALTSTLIEAAHNQIFFAHHLPSLTEITIDNNINSELERFLELMVFNALKA